MVEKTIADIGDIVNKEAMQMLIDSGEAEKLIVFSALCEQLEEEMFLEFSDSKSDWEDIERVVSRVMCNDVLKVSVELSKYISRRVIKGQIDFNDARFVEQCRCMCLAHRFKLLFFKYADSENPKTKFFKRLFE